jgi:hypothetical protein
MKWLSRVAVCGIRGRDALVNSAIGVQDAHCLAASIYKSTPPFEAVLLGNECNS